MARHSRYNGLDHNLYAAAPWRRAVFEMSVHSMFSPLLTPTGVTHPAATRLGLAAACAMLALSAGCGSFDNSSRQIASIVRPFQVEVVQGNVVSKEQVQALSPGMSRAQVREILGSPLVSSVFHADRWDYVFTIRRQGIEAQSRKLTVFFKGEDFDRSEGDTMPSEAEFVTTLSTKRVLGQVPNLQASEQDLAKVQGTPAAVPAAAPTPAAAQVYPPLEPAGK
jgi:outer membrane protein assembly factor BamE